MPWWGWTGLVIFRVLSTLFPKPSPETLMLFDESAQGASDLIFTLFYFFVLGLLLLALVLILLV